MVKQKKKKRERRGPETIWRTIDATQHDNNGEEKAGVKRKKKKKTEKVNKPTEPIAPNHIRVRPGM